MLAGRGLRGVDTPERRYTTPVIDTDVFIALPGRDEPGVTSPDLEPIFPKK